MKNFITLYYIILLLVTLSIGSHNAISQISFMPEEQLTNTEYESELTVSGDAMVIDSDDNVHLIYYEGEDDLYNGSGDIYGSDADQVYYLFGDNGIWQSPIKVSDGELVGEPTAARQPSIAIDSTDTIHIVWHDYRNSGMANVEIYYDYKTPTGSFINGDYRVTYTTSGVAADSGYSPAIAISPQSDKINIVWWDFYYDGYISEAFGLSASDSNDLNRTSSYSLDPYALTSFGEPAVMYPTVVVDNDGFVHTAWCDVESFGYNDGGIAYYRKRTSLEEVPETNVEDYSDILISGTSAGSTNPPKIAIDSSGKAYIVWSDARELGNREIYLTTIDVDGVTKGSEIRLTNSSYNSDNPDIKIDSTDLPRIVWQDNKSGVYQIYYAEYDVINEQLMNETQISQSSSGAIFSHITLDD